MGTKKGSARSRSPPRALPCALWRRLGTSQRPHYVFWNLKTEVSLWKGIQWFPSTLRRRNLKTQQPRVILNLSFWKWITSGREIIWLSWSHRFQKAFSVHTKNEKPAFPNSSGLKSVFRKALFSWRISVDGRPNRWKKKLRFQIPPAQCGGGLIRLSSNNSHHYFWGELDTLQYRSKVPCLTSRPQSESKCLIRPLKAGVNMNLSEI